VDRLRREVSVIATAIRRFFIVCAQVPRGEGREHREIPSAALPSIEYLREVAVRLALLIVALEHLVARDSAPLTFYYSGSSCEIRMSEARGLPEPWYRGLRSRCHVGCHANRDQRGQTGTIRDPAVALGGLVHVHVAERGLHVGVSRPHSRTSRPSNRSMTAYIGL